MYAPLPSFFWASVSVLDSLKTIGVVRSILLFFTVFNNDTFLSLFAAPIELTRSCKYPSKNFFSAAALSEGEFLNVPSEFFSLIVVKSFPYTGLDLNALVFPNVAKLLSLASVYTNTPAGVCIP